MKMQLTIGKIRGLQRCSAPNGTFTILALDHRGNLKRAFNPQSPEKVSYHQIVAFKRALTAALSPYADGILLDPVYGAAQMVARGAVHRSTGILVAVEKTGYAGDASERVSQILPGWGVAKIARMGAAAVKLLLYYHPEAPNAADQEAIVARVAQECQQHDIAFFLEPLSYSLDPLQPKLSSVQKRRVVIETARKLTPMGVDVLKAEFPVDIEEDLDEKVWAEACSELSAASVVPWVLLSAGVSYEAFVRQTRIACQQGASGVLAGRAVWKEAVQLSAEVLDDFLHTTAAERLTHLAEVVRRAAKPWTDFYPHLEAAVGEGWYQQYAAPEGYK